MGEFAIVPSAVAPHGRRAAMHGSARLLDDAVGEWPEHVDLSRAVVAHTPGHGRVTVGRRLRARRQRIIGSADELTQSAQGDPLRDVLVVSREHRLMQGARTPH